MGRIIQGQVVAGTGLDRHGERLSREELRQLFERWHDGLPAGVNHDLSSKPVCRVLNSRLEDLPDGELALKVDLEILDESEFARFGGFSIAFSRRRVRIGQGDADLEVLINPRQFDFDEVVNTFLKRRGDRSPTIDLIERIEKGDVLTAAIISIAVFVGLQTFAGFFNAAGASVFERLRRQKRRDDPAAPCTVQFHLRLSQQRQVPVIILTVDSRCTTADVRAVDGPRLVALIEAEFGESIIQKVAGRLLPGGTVEIDHVTALNGLVLFDAEVQERTDAAR